MVEKAENMFKQHAIREIVLRSKLVILSSWSMLWGTWTCRNGITTVMHEFRAKRTAVERILWTRVIMSMSNLPEVLSVVSIGQQNAAELASVLQQLHSVWPSGPAKTQRPEPHPRSDPFTFTQLPESFFIHSVTSFSLILSSSSKWQHTASEG